VTTIEFSEPRNVIGHMTARSPRDHLLKLVIWNGTKPLAYNL